MAHSARNRVRSSRDETAGVRRVSQVTARGPTAAVIAGLLLAALALIVESQVVSTLALGGMLVLLPAGVLMELVRGGAPTRSGAVKTVLVVSLFVCGVLVFADARALAIAAGGATILLLVATGLMEGNLRAVWWAAVLVLSAVTADILWQLDWAPFDRSDQYEPIAQFPFVLIGVPLLMGLIAAGVAARWLWRQLLTGSAPPPRSTR
jgi:hypothetical protein